MVFLETALGFRLATAVIITMFSKKTLPSTLLRIIYNQSMVYLSVACSLDLYKQSQILLRVSFFGGKFSQLDFEKRYKRYRVEYIVLVTLIPIVNLILIFANGSDRSLSLYLSYAALLTCLLLTVMFLETSLKLNYRLKLYFGANYQK